MAENPWWERVTTGDLAQGELVYQCAVPILPDDFSPTPGSTVPLGIEEFDLIVLTQTCDLVLSQKKTDTVAACPFRPVDGDKSLTWERLEEIRKGRREGLHLLACPADHADLAKALLVDFRQVFTLPIGYLMRRASENQLRYRLRSPYLEHFSQAFGRLFERVALNPGLGPYTKAFINSARTNPPD